MARPDVTAALRELDRKHGGKLTPKIVVDEARRTKGSALWKMFTWDVKRAAEAHWYYTARHLIDSIKVDIVTEHFTIKAPVYVRDPSVPSHEQGFISVAKLRSDIDLSREAVINEFARAAAALTRAKAVSLALGLADEIEAIRGRVIDLSERARGASA